MFVESGDVLFEYRNFAFLSEESVLAAEASLCANDQEQFWPYHDLIFYNQGNPELGNMSRENLDLFAEHLDLDMDAFETCMDENTHREMVEDEFEEAESLGVGGTPAFLLDGELVTEMQTYGDLFDLIEERVTETQ